MGQLSKKRKDNSMCLHNTKQRAISATTTANNNRKPHGRLLRKQSLPPLKDLLAFQSTVMASRRQLNILEWSQNKTKHWSSDQRYSPLTVTVDPHRNETATTVSQHKGKIHYRPAELGNEFKKKISQTGLTSHGQEG